MWVLIDNYDSFTHILHHYLLQLHNDVRVFRNDVTDVARLNDLNPQRIIISPGPKDPHHAGNTLSIINAFFDRIPILGICLGHQALAIHYGADLDKGLIPMHGKTSNIQVVQHDLFKNLPNSFSVMRYHSLVVRNWREDQMTPLAFSDDGELMAFVHTVYPSIGLQFHPESVLTQNGLLILKNWDEIYD
jgi:anthranilate synthase/aminodeoxychorismate synthase-like glutamine amidotransferase